MTPLSITTNMDQNPWEDCFEAPVGHITRIGRLPNATISGKSIVAVMIELEGGKKVVGQITLALFKNALVAINAADGGASIVGGTS